MKNCLYIAVEAYAGSDIPEQAIPQLLTLAGKLGINVHCDLNGVQVMAKPGADPVELAGLWRAELNSKHAHKIACAHPPETHAQGD